MTLANYREALAGAGLAPRTITEYTKCVRRLHVWCRKRGHDPHTLTAHDLRAWADTLPISWSMRKQARSALRRYYRMVGRDDTPWDAIRVPRKPKPRYRGLPPEQARTLRDAALIIGGRSGLAVLLGLYTAARCSEIAEMRWDGVADDFTTIRWWRPKTEEWHDIPLHPILGTELRVHREEGYIFQGDRGRKHVSTGTVWSWVVHVADAAGLGHVSPHQLRATAISMVLEATGDLDAAAELAGHRDPAVTRQHYTQTSIRRLQAAVDAFDAYDH